MNATTILVKTEEPVRTRMEVTSVNAIMDMEEKIARKVNVYLIGSRLINSALNLSILHLFVSLFVFFFSCLCSFVFGNCLFLTFAFVIFFDFIRKGVAIK